MADSMRQPGKSRSGEGHPAVHWRAIPAAKSRRIDTPDEQLMIVSGEGRLQMKGAADQTIGTGAFVHLPSKHQHAFRCATACTFYLSSNAAFDIHYVDAAGNEISPQQALAGSNAAKTAAKEQ